MYTSVTCTMYSHVGNSSKLRTLLTDSLTVHVCIEGRTNMLLSIYSGKK